LFRYGLIRPVADPGLRPVNAGRWCASSPNRTIWARSGTGSGFPGSPWTGGSGPGGPAASTPWSPQPATPSPTRPRWCWAPSARPLHRPFPRLELNTRPDGAAPKAFGRFEAAAPNDRWTGDALHGPVVAGRKTYLFAFIDDHSRALTGYRWGHSEDTVRLEAALHHGISARGVPRAEMPW